VEAVLRKEKKALTDLKSAFEQMTIPIVVRSSGIGEDSKGASFAGQHISVLNVSNFSQLISAIAKVLDSSLTSSTQSYREKMGINDATKMGIVLQELHHSEAAGVMFTKNPLNGARERVIEAAWGLGEVVVAGLVIPDYYRLSLKGDILERRIGEKDIALRLLPQGGTEEMDIPPEKANAKILEDTDLQKLHRLALRCESVFGKHLDIEWSLAGGQFTLLQCRAITTSHG
jgi:pyruvate,water dikinase